MILRRFDFLSSLFFHYEVDCLVEDFAANILLNRYSHAGAHLESSCCISNISPSSCFLSVKRKRKKADVNVKRVAHTLAKGVLDFWHSIESHGQETSKVLEQQYQKNGAFTVRAYAVRFLNFNKPNISHNQAAVPLTPDRMSDSGILDLMWEDSLTEENLFCTIPPGAMVTYRMAIESHVAELEGVETSLVMLQQNIKIMHMTRMRGKQTHITWQWPLKAASHHVMAKRSGNT